MKKHYFAELSIVILALTLGGCYTIAWNPDDKNFPTKENSQQLGDSLSESSEYDFYDNTPWWFKLNPPNYSDNADDSEENFDPITIIDIAPGFLPMPLPIAPPIATRPIINPHPVKKTDDKSQNTGSRENNNTNNNSSKSRNDNGSRNTDNGRGK